MSRLKGMRCYLAGAMSFDDNAVRWRLEIGEFLKRLGVVVLDPTNKPIDIGIENKERQIAVKGYYDEFSRLMKEIRCVDLRMVDIADFLIVNIDLRIYSVGTWEELFWANRCKKPIIVRCAQGKIDAPPWLFGTIPHQFIMDDWDEVKDYLDKVDKGFLGESGDRWYFFGAGLFCGGSAE